MMMTTAKLIIRLFSLIVGLLMAGSCFAIEEMKSTRIFTTSLRDTWVDWDPLIPEPSGHEAPITSSILIWGWSVSMIGGDPNVTGDQVEVWRFNSQTGKSDALLFALQGDQLRISPGTTTSPERVIWYPQPIRLTVPRDKVRAAIGKNLSGAFRVYMYWTPAPPDDASKITSSANKPTPPTNKPEQNSPPKSGKKDTHNSKTD